MRNETVSTIAEAMGWKGCRGFNELIHSHTNYPLKAIFVDSRKEIAYSERKYVQSRNYIENEDKEIAFCVLCIRDDINERGFTYWRRRHQAIRVCAKHNTNLLFDCPYCGMKLSLHEGRGIATIWHGCRGKQLADCLPTTNKNPKWHSSSKIYDQMCLHEYHIPKYLALEVLKVKLQRLVGIDGASCSEGEYYLSRIRSCQTVLSNSNLVELDWHGITQKIVESIFFCYDDFDDFLADVNKNQYPRFGLNSTMDNYYR
jgi:hypothetical protein